MCSFFVSFRFSPPFDLITSDVSKKWIQICQEIIDAPAPGDNTQLDENLPLSFWEVKEWALHIFVRIFERQHETYQNARLDFRRVLLSLVKELDGYRDNKYVSPKFLTETLRFMKTA